MSILCFVSGRGFLRSRAIVFLCDCFGHARKSHYEEILRYANVRDGRPTSGRRIGRWLDTSKLYFPGATDRHVSCGELLCVYLQHQTPELSSSLDGGLARFRSSLHLSRHYAIRRIQCPRRRADALAVRAFCVALLPRCADLCAAAELEMARPGGRRCSGNLGC